jgi:hypothetical protein
MVRDVHGDLWVADSHAGVCRVLEGAHPPGEGLDTTPALPVCATDPAAFRYGPTALGQVAFDPATRNMYIGDLASGSGGVWRLHLDETSNPAVIDTVELIADFSNPLVGDRIFGMAYHAGLDVLDFSTKNSPNILRIANPAACPALPGANAFPPAAPPLTSCTALPMGNAQVDATASLVHDTTGRLYIADLNGVTSITPGSVDTSARDVPGLGGAYSALAYDPQNDLLYAGTTNLDGADQIDVMKVSTGQIATYATGFDAVTGIGIDFGGSGANDNGLDIADDPGVKQVGEDLGGTGRRWTSPFEEFQPRPTIVDGPANLGNVRTVTFFFTYENATDFFCSLDGGPAVACGTATSASQRTYADLPDGAHTFQVQVGNTTTGQKAKRGFVVDTRAPVATIDAVAVSGSSAEIGFSADDPNVDFTCGLDGGASVPCDNPVRYAGLANGDHTLTLRAVDFVGNLGPVATRVFRIGPPPPPPWKPGKVLASLNGRTLRVAFNAPPGARYVRFLVTKKSVYPVRTRTARIRGGTRNVVTIVLPRAAAQRLQRRGFQVRVDAGPTTRRLNVHAGRGALRIIAALRSGGSG